MPKYPASGPRPSDALILSVLRHLDRETHVVTEGSSEDAIVQDMAVRLGYRNVHFSPRGGGLGWATLGVGIGLATGKHAVCFVGDGGSLFSIHALWTAAKYAIPSIFVCFVNNEYRLLKDLWCNVMGTTIETTHFVGMDFSDPDVDMQKIAEGFGARVEKIEDIQTVGDVGGAGRCEGGGAGPGHDLLHHPASPGVPIATAPAPLNQMDLWSSKGLFIWLVPVAAKFKLLALRNAVRKEGD